THVSAAQLRFGVPSGSSTGKVALTNAAGTATSVADFKVGPKITSFDPASARRLLDTVTIHGTNFTGATAVKVGAVLVPGFTVVDDTKITLTLPPTAVTGKLSVTTPAGTATSATNLVVILPPTLSSFTPSSGPVGTTVTVTGANLDSVTAATLTGVDVGTITHVSAAQLRFVVPSGSSTGKVALTNAAGTATSVADFKVGPKITSFDPASARRLLDTVTIHGTNFTGATAVKVGAVLVPGFTVVDDTKITLTLPPTAVTGKLSVTTPAGTATSATNLVVISPPTLSSFTPSSGPVGTTVTVTGANLDSVTAATLNGVDVGT